MKLLTFLTLLPLTLGMALPVEKRDAPLPFEGLGQLIVTDWSHIDIGCLITTGEYTADFSKCATFTGFRKFTRMFLFPPPPYPYPSPYPEPRLQTVKRKGEERGKADEIKKLDHQDGKITEQHTGI